MVDPTSGAENDRATRPDAYGQAAILLVESLMHGLIARAVISVPDALEIIDTAAEVNVEIDDERGDIPANGSKSLAILAAISASLRHDVAD